MADNNKSKFEQHSSKFEAKAMTKEEVKEFLLKFRQPCVAMVDIEEGQSSRSWLGGEPCLPLDIEWPMYQSDVGLEIPMHFLAQIDLSACPRIEEMPLLPETGFLFVFIEPLLAPLDMDGEAITYAGKGMKILHVDRDLQGVKRRLAPVMPDLSSDDDIYLSTVETSHSWWTPPEEDRHPCFNYKPVAFIESVSYPFFETAFAYDKKINFKYPKVDEERWKALEDRENYLRAVISDIEEGRTEPAERMPENMHTLFGAPHLQLNTVSSDIALRADQEPADSINYVKLFGFALDDQLGIASRERGGIGIYIKRKDLEAANFSNLQIWGEFNG